MNKCPMSKCPVYGSTNSCKPQLKPANWRLLRKVNAFDAARKTRYIPDRPAYLPAPPNGPFPEQWVEGETYPWLSNTIPFEPVEGNVPPTLPNADGYNKFIAIDYYLPFYAGIDPFTFSEDDPKGTLFQVNLLNRGPNNYRKKVYMNATRNCIMDQYAARIDNFVNRAYAQMTTYGRPVVSSFKQEVLSFFLKVHLGDEEFPDYIYEYFNRFTNLISFQNREYYENINGKGSWDKELMYGWQTSVLVFDYFDKRAQQIVEKEDTTTLAYWWFEAGLDITAISTECLHNIFAFDNFIGILRTLILDKVGGVPYPPPPFGPGPIKYDFFAKFALAQTGFEKMNVSREMMRLTSPSVSSTSRLDPKVPTPEGEVAQTRHLNQLIMVTNEAQLSGNPLAYFKYDTNRYAGWDADFDNDACPVIVTNPGDLDDPAKKFTLSPIDNETIVDKSEPNMFPVFQRPTYMPFGLGYRRCAGENFVHLVNFKIFERFGNLEYEIRQPQEDYPLIGIGFVTRVRDNIFVKQPTSAS